MKRFFLGFASVVVISIIAACSSDNTGATPGSSGTSGTSGTTEDSGTPEEEGGGGGTQCTSARDTLLLPIAKVSTGEVKVVSEAGGVTTLYVDASAGGLDQAAKNPRIYITIAGTKVDVNDKDAPTSTDWDLALKRAVLFTNSGDAGAGKGGGVMVKKAFDAVTKADADAAKPLAEAFFDEDCNAKKDPNGDVSTSFSGWYSYDEATHIPAPITNQTFIIKSAAGVRYKIGIDSYQGKPDGTKTNQGTAFYLLKVAQL